VSNVDLQVPAIKFILRKGGFIGKMWLLLSSCLSVMLAVWTPVGPPGGPVYSGGISNTSPAVIYFAPYTSPVRLIKSNDEGVNWTYTSGMVPGYVYDLLVPPADPELVYALAGSVIYKSTDGGSTWATLAIPSYNYLRQMCFNPLNPNVIYAVGYNYSQSPYRMVVVRTTDAGATWSTFVCSNDSLNSYYGYSITIDPVDTGTVYAGGYRGSGATVIYRSTDRGETWEELPFGVTGYYPYAIVVNPADPNIIIAAPYSGGIYRSTDRGQTWTRTAAIYSVYRLAYSRNNPAVIYATTTSTIYRSDDTGRSWVNIGTGVIGKPYFCLFPSFSQDGAVYLGTTAGLFYSADYGNNWEDLTGDFPFNKVKVITLANDEGTVYVECLDNGIYKSTDNGNTWTRCSDFLACGNICAIGVNPNDPLDLWALEGSG